MVIEFDTKDVPGTFLFAVGSRKLRNHKAFLCLHSGWRDSTPFTLSLPYSVGCHDGG